MTLTKWQQTQFELLSKAPCHLRDVVGNDDVAVSQLGKQLEDAQLIKRPDGWHWQIELTALGELYLSALRDERINMPDFWASNPIAMVWVIELSVRPNERQSDGKLAGQVMDVLVPFAVAQGEGATPYPNYKPYMHYVTSSPYGQALLALGVTPRIYGDDVKGVSYRMPVGMVDDIATRAKSLGISNSDFVRLAVQALLSKEGATNE